MRRLRREPVAVQAALTATFNVLVAFHYLALDAGQVAAVNAALVAGFGLFVRRAVTPLRHPRNHRGQHLVPAPAAAAEELAPALAQVGSATATMRGSL